MRLIVVPSKRVDLLLRIVQRLKPVDIQTLFAEATIEGFDGCVVGRFAASAEIPDGLIKERFLGRTDEPTIRPALVERPFSTAN